MKKLIAIFIVFISVHTYGQTEYENLSKSQLIEGYYLAIDEVIIQLDSINNNILKQKWIEKIEFIKDEKYKDIYGNTGGKIFIFPKKRFKKKLLEYYKHE